MIPIDGGLDLKWLYGIQGGGIIRIHTYGTSVYNIGTLNNHALCAGVIRVDGVDIGA